jgi:1-acyl-sn-glycerol-3-phosphate acyltransferase
MSNILIPYPRRIVPRTLARILGRTLLPFLFKIQKSGFHFIPETGPLIVVGNHSAIMEVVLMVVFMPRQVELLGSIDVPHEPALDLITRFYGYIPYRRGQLERKPLRQALAVLEQGGVLGIFPEGGIWQISERRVQPGVAWLSEKSQAPVLPIFFSGTSGAIHQAIRLGRPNLRMIIGEPIPPAINEMSIPQKQFFIEYATRVMDAVDELRPPEYKPLVSKYKDEKFFLTVEVWDKNQKSIILPEAYQLKHPTALAKFLHYPTILKIFKVNFRMPIDALQQLSLHPNPKEISDACLLILYYLENKNPYLLTYRFGPREGGEMQAGLVSLYHLSKWASESDMKLWITPIREYIDVETGQEVVQTEQGTFKNWM